VGDALTAKRDNSLEEWRICPSLPNYMASNWGRIMRVPFMGPTPNGHGVRHYHGKPYHGVWHADERRFAFVHKGKNYKVHRLVCEAWNGPPPFEGAVVMHLDEDSRNNRPENLKWGTQKENLAAPGFRKWAKSRGRAGLRKLSETDVLEIKRGVERGDSMASLARLYGVSACHVSQICNGKIWRTAA